MTISQIASYSASVAGTAYVPTVMSAAQLQKAAAFPTPSAFNVELSDSAQTKSLHMLGYSALQIAIKLELSISAVKEFLGSPLLQNQNYRP